MIITCLRGGLGNQMFQYAIGRRLAEKYGTELLLDVTRFKEDKLREYVLSDYCIKAKVAEENEICIFNEANKYKRTWMNIKQFIKGRYIPKVREKSLRFDPNILNKGDNIYLLGYWQTEKYFKEIAAILCKEFQLKRKLTKEEQKFENMIKSTPNAVSLHIRRGDYVTDPNANKHHGVCSLDYYEKAIELMCDKIGKIHKIHLFVFSDDLEWSKENLRTKHPITFIDYRRVDDGHADMYLMSLCKHHIIANSSFSWWGAWLNSNSHKIVIAPKQWFRSDTLNYRDVVPETWIKI